MRSGDGAIRVVFLQWPKEHEQERLALESWLETQDGIVIVQRDEKSTFLLRVEYNGKKSKQQPASVRLQFVEARFVGNQLAGGVEMLESVLSSRSKPSCNSINLDCAA
jgi:hypothetical protein